MLDVTGWTRTLLGMLLLLTWGALRARAEVHSLDPLDATEIELGFTLLQAHFAADTELPDRDLLFPLLALREPEKALRSDDGSAAPGARKAEAQVFHFPSNRTWLAELDLTARRLTRLTLAPLGTQPALSGDEYEVAAQLVRAHEPWREAVRARGQDPDRAHIDVWAPGHVELDDALPGLVRAQFAKHTLWVSRFAEDERFAAGAFPVRRAPARESVATSYLPSRLHPSKGQTWCSGTHSASVTYRASRTTRS